MAVGVGEDEGAKVVRGEPDREGHLRGRGGLRAGERSMGLDHLVGVALGSKITFTEHLQAKLGRFLRCEDPSYRDD